MLNRTGAALGLFGMAMLVAAIPFGVVPMLALGACVLAAVALAATPARLDVAASATLPPGIHRIHHPVAIEVEVDVRAGRGGSLLLRQPLPPELQLVSGSNLLLAPTRRGRHVLSFSVRSPRRGRFTLPPLEWTHVPALHVAHARQGTCPTARELEFRADAPRFTRLVGARQRSDAFLPMNDQARIGIRTMEFDDLRPYRRGDPLKAINWKATARHAARQPPHKPVLPLVNTYEVEGQKRVWILLDAGRSMRVGTNVDNAFEAGARATASLARLFLDRGARVGLSVFNLAQPILLPPDAGSRQLWRIESALHGIEPTDLDGGLPAAVEQARPYVSGRSWVVVVGRAPRLDAPAIAALRRLRALSARRRRATMLFVDVDPNGLVPLDPVLAPAVRSLQAAMDRPAVERLRASGIRTITWDPQRRHLEAQLLAVTR